MLERARSGGSCAGDSLFAVGLCLVALSACAQVDAGRGASASIQEDRPTTATSSGEADPAQRVVLHLGEETTVGDLTLTWTEVEDSRCPIDVQCIWEGRVVVTLEVSVGDEDPETVRLTNHPDGLREDEDGDLAERLRLVDVEPYPHSERPIERSDYRALIQIKAASSDSTPTATAEVSGEFRLQRIDAQTWRAGDCYTQPVEAIRFERPFEGLRENSWRPANCAFEQSYGEGTAELWRGEREPFECAEIELALYTERPEKNYYAFSSFSDGGMSVYTGYLTGPVLVEGEWREVAMAASYVGLMASV